MPRKLRHVPEKTTLMEITCRTLGEMYLLKPTRELEQIIVGIVGRAQRLHPVLIHNLVFMSNHFHMLITPGSAKLMARFMRYVNGNIAQEAVAYRAGNANSGPADPWPSRSATSPPCRSV